jgi:uncharacterized protein
VILLDANVLIYAHVASFTQHAASREWLDAQLNGTAAVAFPWPTLLAFLRIVTNPRIFEEPEPISQAWEQVTAWLACESSWIPQPGDRHAEILADLLADPSVRGNLVQDAHLAALAIEHGLQLCSTDGDFGRFPGLRWSNPLRA